VKIKKNKKEESMIILESQMEIASLLAVLSFYPQDSTSKTGKRNQRLAKDLYISIFDTEFSFREKDKE